MSLVTGCLLIRRLENQPITVRIRDHEGRRRSVVLWLPLRRCRLALVRDRDGGVETVVACNSVQAWIVEEVEDLEVLEFALGGLVDCDGVEHGVRALRCHEVEFIGSSG